MGHSAVSALKKLQLVKLVGIIYCNHGHLAILGQFKIYVNICTNDDKHKSILTSFSKTENIGINTNFEFDKLVLIDCISSLKNYFFPFVISRL
jgi:hypothetical protein